MEDARLYGSVALVLAIMLAGCAEPAGTIRLDPVTGEQIAAHASRSVGGPHAQPADRIVPAAVENGSVTVSGLSPPVQDGLPFAYDGAYYNLSWATVNTSSAVAVSISTNYSTAAPDAASIAYADLPGPDRKALQQLLPPQERLHSERARLGATTVYNATEQDVSVFTPEQQYAAVVYDGVPYRIRVEEPRPVTVHRYQYTEDMVAPSASLYAGQLRDRHLFTLADLSAAERSVVAKAQNDTYYAENDGDTAFQAVLDRFREQSAVRRSEGEGDWLVQYEGTIYWAELMFYQFTDEA